MCEACSNWVNIPATNLNFFFHDRVKKQAENNEQRERERGKKSVIKTGKLVENLFLKDWYLVQIYSFNGAFTVWWSCVISLSGKNGFFVSFI